MQLKEPIMQKSERHHSRQQIKLYALAYSMFDRENLVISCFIVRNYCLVGLPFSFISGRTWSFPVFMSKIIAPFDFRFCSFFRSFESHSASRSYVFCCCFVCILLGVYVRVCVCVVVFVFVFCFVFLILMAMLLLKFTVYAHSSPISIVHLCFSDIVQIAKWRSLKDPMAENISESFARSV